MRRRRGADGRCVMPRWRAVGGRRAMSHRRAVSARPGMHGRVLVGRRSPTCRSWRQRGWVSRHPTDERRRSQQCSCAAPNDPIGRQAVRDLEPPNGLLGDHAELPVNGARREARCGQSTLQRPHEISRVVAPKARRQYDRSRQRPRLRADDSVDGQTARRLKPHDRAPRQWAVHAVDRSGRVARQHQATLEHPDSR